MGNNKNKKNDIDSILNEQRKNLRFVDSGVPLPSKQTKFVTVDDAILNDEIVPAPVAPAPAPSVRRPYVKQNVGEYVDLRKFKIEKNKKRLEEQNAAAKNVIDEKLIDDDDDDDLFGIDYVMGGKNKKNENLNFDSVGNKFVSPRKFASAKNEIGGTKPAPSALKSASIPPRPALDIVPEPEKVRKPRVEKAAQKAKRSKTDADLIPQKTYFTYFDDLE